MAAALVVSQATPAAAQTGRDYFARLAEAIQREYEAALAARLPPLVPPEPIVVSWKATRIGSVDLGEPVVGMLGTDLDGDKKGELYVVTTRHVVALAITDRKLRELARVAFHGPAASLQPRDPVGTLVVDGLELVAAASPWAKEMRLFWKNATYHGPKEPRTLVGRTGDAPFLVCPGERIALAPGRNHFGDTASPLYSVRCVDGLRDAEGYPIRVRATQTAGSLDVGVSKCGRTGTSCEAPVVHSFKDYGAALEVADVDRDGTPEVIVTGAGAPGDPDAIKVIELGGDTKKGVFRHRFHGGIVAVSTIDSDGDGRVEVVAAVRLAGATRFDVWRFN